MRKAREVASAKAAGEYATAGCLSATLGHANPKKTSQLPDIVIVLWLPEPATTRTLPARLGTILPAIQRVLLESSDPASADATVPGVFVVDCSLLLPAGCSARDIMDKELSDAGADGHLGKQVTKPVSRVLDRLCSGYRGSITLVGVQESAPLALCLLEHGAVKWGPAVKRIALLKPHLSAAAVNALLVKPAQAQAALDVLYQTARDCQRRDAPLRHAYPDGASRVLDSHVTVGGALHAALCPHSSADQGAALRGYICEAYMDMACLRDKSQTRPSGALSLLLDPDEIDSCGRAVWWSEWSFEINTRTKQPQTVVSRRGATATCCRSFG